MQLIHKDRKEPDIKYCAKCGKEMHSLYPDEYCPICKEYLLFQEVKDYIRSGNDIHEQDVAEHFNIPIRKVREWIKEGRIQYKGETAGKFSSVHCSICGKPITFGTVCPECHSLQKLQVVATNQTTENAEMHFLNKKIGE